MKAKIVFLTLATTTLSTIYATDDSLATELERPVEVATFPDSFLGSRLPSEITIIEFQPFTTKNKSISNFSPFINRKRYGLVEIKQDEKRFDLLSDFFMFMCMAQLEEKGAEWDKLGIARIEDSTKRSIELEVFLVSPSQLGFCLDSRHYLTAADATAFIDYIKQQ